MVINSFTGLEKLLKEKFVKKTGKIVKSKGRWINLYYDHSSDKLKIRLLLDEKIKGKRIVGLEAKIKADDTHQLHLHEEEYVFVYTLFEKCKVTVGDEIKMVTPRTMIFIPPKITHRFEN